MQTIIQDWYIIKVLDPKNEELLGQLLWGIVLADDTNRFRTGCYVCSSLIKTIDLKLNLVITQSNSRYKLDGKGSEFSAYFSEVKLLDKGFDPDQIIQLRRSKEKHDV